VEARETEEAPRASTRRQRVGAIADTDAVPVIDRTRKYYDGRIMELVGLEVARPGSRFNASLSN
jgi:hypothetical protein